MDKVTYVQGFRRGLRFSPVNIVPPVIRNSSLIRNCRCIILVSNNVVKQKLNIVDSNLLILFWDMISVGEISSFHRGVVEVFALLECCAVCFTVSTLNMRSIGRPETSVSNYKPTSSVGATARCGLWPVEQYLSIFPSLSPTVSICSLPTLEDLFPLLSTFSWVFLFVSSLPVFE